MAKPIDPLKEAVKDAVEAFYETTGIVPVAIELRWLEKECPPSWGGLQETQCALSDIKVIFAAKH